MMGFEGAQSVEMRKTIGSGGLKYINGNQVDTMDGHHRHFYHDDNHRHRHHLHRHDHHHRF